MKCLLCQKTMFESDSDIGIIYCGTCEIFFFKKNYFYVARRNIYIYKGNNYSIDEFKRYCKLKAFL